MEKHTARLIRAFIKGGVSKSDQGELEQELAKLLQQASQLGKQYGLVMVENQQRAVTTKDVTIGAGVYLFLKRAKDIVSGIVERIRDIISEIISDGGTDEDVDDAIGNLIDYLPDTIAETEIHTEVEEAIAGVLKYNDVKMVEWVTSPGACPMCVGNEEEGPIELGEEFPSGDTSPPSHPRCRCNLVPSLDVVGS